MILEVISWILFSLGALFILAGSIGVVRFPDFYTRIHAAGVTDTLGTELILLAMILQSDAFSQVIKLVFIALFLLMTSPVATHALAHAAWVGGLHPRTGKDLTYAEEGEEGYRD
jgi:multicomponent Na+:H+ antiporter subunit G